MIQKFVVAILAVFALVSCKPDQDLEIGGKGGTATLVIVPLHHGVPVDSCTVFIKYNTLDRPSDNSYDDSAKCVQENGKPTARFTALKKGKYFLYANGYDTSIAETVIGGIPYTLSVQDMEQKVNLPVSED